MLEKKLDVWVTHELSVEKKDGPTHTHIFDDSPKIIRDLNWEVLMHTPYSPDISPSDYHLFRSLQNSLHGTELASRDACKKHLIQFLNQKPRKFNTDGIMVLPGKWQNIGDDNGEYLVRMN